MKFLLDLDLFGKEPHLYYKGKSKRNTIAGLIITIIHILLVLFFFIFKLVRMMKRIDAKFYDTFSYGKEIPSINVTNDALYGAFRVGGFIDETLYHIKAQYVSRFKNGDIWNKDLEIETCNIEKFGEKHRELFRDEQLNKSYCLKNINLSLEGYSYLDSFSYINLKVFPCVNHTKDGRPCKDYNTIYNFFKKNLVEFKMQDNLLTPENYKSPVRPFKKDITCPIFLQIYQKIYSYIQIIRVETNEDITGINLIPKNKVEIFPKYQDSFVIATPGSDEILKTGGSVCDITLQLAANVLTQKRYYKTLTDVMGETGGFMYFFYVFFKIILSLVVDESYEQSLVSDLFSFDIKKKQIILKNIKVKNNKNDKTTLNFQKYENNFIKYKSVINNTTNNEDLTEVGMENNSSSGSVSLGITDGNFKIIGARKTEKDEIIENINKICLSLRNKKTSLYKILLEEGMNLITEKLDITKLFYYSYIVEKNKKNLTIDSSMPISKNNREYISKLEKNKKKSENKIV